jgi:hypothetical protein
MQLMRVTKQLMGDTGVMTEINERLAQKAGDDPDIDIEATISDAIAGGAATSRLFWPME